MEKSILITGGAGFIGSHTVRLFVNRYPQYRIVNLDKLTYAGNLHNLTDVESAANYHFVKGDIQDKAFLERLFAEHDITDVIHLAAESHVDRSISGPLAFVATNVLGTAHLLEVARHYWKDATGHVFYHVSTDEVYGSLGEEGYFRETTPYDPRSPYSASKASADHLASAYYHTYQLPVKLSNCSNNYGSHQFPEKLIPLMIHRIKNEQSLPVYGTGKNVRDWLWVEDHARAIDVVFHRGQIGATYAIGGGNEWTNIDLVNKLCALTDRRLNRLEGASQQLIAFVDDRAGHDQRYAIDASKIKRELDWSPSISFEQGLEMTIDWYLNNEQWLDEVTSGEYQDYYKTHYA